MIIIVAISLHIDRAANLIKNKNTQKCKTDVKLGLTLIDYHNVCNP